MYIHFLSLSYTQRFGLVDRIVSAVDEYRTLKRENDSSAGCRLPIRAAELRADGTLWQAMRLDPLRHMRALQQACRDVAAEHRPGSEKEGGSRITGVF